MVWFGWLFAFALLDYLDCYHGVDGGWVARLIVGGFVCCWVVNSVVYFNFFC